MHAVLWVIAAGLTFYYADVAKVVLGGDARIRRVWYIIGVLCFGVCSSIILYMAVWVPRVLGIHLEPNVYSPNMLPIAAVFGVVSAIALNVGLWPVYGLLTPFILGVLWFGGIMCAHFLPSM